MTRGSFTIVDENDLRCEILIVGSGAGGSAAAEVLTAAGHDVLMVEEGPAIWHDQAPASMAESMQKMWRANGLTAALGPVPVAYAEGRCLGGGTEINSAIMQRAPDEVVADWAENYKIANFGPAQLRPYYDRVWKAVNASLTPGDSGPPTNILREGGQKMGWKVTELERAQQNGTRQSMTATLIPQALKQGLRILTQCRIERLSGSGDRIDTAHGTALDQNGRRCAVTIRCDHVFMAAGAIHTPALLRRSGIKKNIGNSLRLHPTLKVLVEFDREVNAVEHKLPVVAITEFMPRLRLGGSVFTPGFFGMSLAENWQVRRELAPRIANCAMYYTMVRASGQGRIRPIPGLHEPLVSYAFGPNDLADLAGGLERLAEAMLALGVRRVYPSIGGHEGWAHRKDFDAVEILRRKPKRGQVMSIHLFSSCPMGEDRTRCAVDSFGRVHGWKNLTIADASVIPEAPGVNPQATIMALAYRAAEAWRANA